MKHIEILDMERTTFYVSFPMVDRKVPHRLGALDWLAHSEGHGFSFGGNGIYFYNEQDAVMFALKWS